jgi:hypothetical protein
MVCAANQSEAAPHGRADTNWVPIIDYRIFFSTYAILVVDITTTIVCLFQGGGAFHYPPVGRKSRYWRTASQPEDYKHTTRREPTVQMLVYNYTLTLDFTTCTLEV